MAKQIINNNESALAVRTKLNENFDELYDDLADKADVGHAHSEYVEGSTHASDLAEKVDKVAGKGLSTNDYTDAQQSQVGTAYAHSQVSHAPSTAPAAGEFIPLVASDTAASEANANAIMILSNTSGQTYPAMCVNTSGATGDDAYAFVPMMDTTTYGG